ncbi:MAG TPA: acetate--CoA ligase family protein [Anaerolineaceae bacterium]|nr:acetate--CoA ligase family protein [Anaerolineaceae bacterium]HNW13764.1 acetate--CoA ligase family protein [Anaerolineaceae bacterium]HOE02589.1 acetate--CoA ligase family protein [Anaerolineaceae bacterium]HOQ68582.1 acetate--CoA ligase family protein [Anaerolineaceae bacterium]HOS54172.1 acetate--CoA ligase family protein [Anaerolineaceae bacterium]
MDKTGIEKMLRPKSVAVIGASATPGKIGYTVIKNLLKDGYKGKIYPINQKESEILGLKCYPEIGQVPGEIDSAVMCVPAKVMAEVVEECGRKGVKGALVITSGFSEIGRKDLEDEVVRIARHYGMRILGPNIVGTLSNSEKFNGSFAPCLPLPGKNSLVTQSGALLIAMDMATYSRRIGYEKMISIGNMADVDFADLIEWFQDDEETSCVSLYIEGLRDGRRFIDVAKKSNKPIIALKSGVSAHGAAAAASHTGSLAGGAKVYSAAFKQAGVIQATDLDNLFYRGLTLSMQPPMKGDNFLIITNGGGNGVLATDAAERFGIPLKFAPDDVQAEMKKHMPEYGSAKNPVDMTGMAGNDWYYETVKFAIMNKWTDSVVVLYCETAITDPAEIAASIKRAVDDSGVKDKPITVSFVGGEKSDKAIGWMVENGIPAFFAPDTAVNAMAALREYAKLQENKKSDGAKTDEKAKKLALEVIAAARADGRTSLTEIEAKKVFELYGMPTTKIGLAKTEEEAVKLSKEIGYPIVMKIVSPDILHKSDAGGVKVNIKTEAEAREAYNTILKNAKAYKADANIHGIAVQEMAPWGTEVILGSVSDPSFGPTVMFGLGGIFVEVLKDVTFRVTPVSKAEAEEMVSEIRGAPILSGVRGEAPRDRKAIIETIIKYSSMIYDLMDEIAESDANPVLVYAQGEGLRVADARIILKKK